MQRSSCQSVRQSGVIAARVRPLAIAKAQPWLGHAPPGNSELHLNFMSGCGHPASSSVYICYLRLVHAYAGKPAAEQASIASICSATFMGAASMPLLSGHGWLQAEQVHMGVQLEVACTCSRPVQPFPAYSGMSPHQPCALQLMLT